LSATYVAKIVAEYAPAVCVLKVAVTKQDVPVVPQEGGATVGAVKPGVATDVKAMMSLENNPG
jgi:hypothetical protein